MSYEGHNFKLFEMATSVRYSVASPYRHKPSNGFSSLSDSQKRAVIAAVKRALYTQIDGLARKWVTETCYLSSPSAIKKHPIFSKLTTMGPLVTKYSLEKLKIPQNRMHWMILLKEISGEDPVPDYARGIIDEMSASWLGWGASKGLV